MIDLKRLRSDPAYRAGIERKRVRDGLVDEVLAADEAHRALLSRVEELRSRQNAASKEIGKATPEERPAKIAAAAALKAELAALDPELGESEGTLRALALQVPNAADPSVPDGGEDDGEVLRVVGEVVPAPVLDHAAFAEAMGFVNTEKAVEMSGSRFAYLIREAVMVELALAQWALGLVAAQGFTAVMPPILVREHAMEEAGFFPTDRQQVYEVDEGELFLVGTSEVPLSALHRGEILDADALPLRYAGLSSNFRREAGTYGKDTRGIFRVHQFDKVEMFAYAAPDESADEHERILAIEESIIGALGLPYRVVNIAAGDLGAAAAKKFDIEVWLASEGRYRELTSCSNYHGYSARRLVTAVRGDDGTQLVHTLNGTACAIGRTLVFLFEHYQEPDGAFVVPDVLRPFTGFDRVEPTRLVSTRLSEIVVDSVDPVALARWWQETLGWEPSTAEPDERMLRAPDNDEIPALLFLTVPEPKRGKNRVHLDLASESVAHQAATVEALLARSATRADVGQSGTPWVVLADPEGNELCVLEPRDEYRGIGRLAGITVDARDPRALAPFWAAATGWSIAREVEGTVMLLPPSGRPPDLALVQVDDPKVTKLRWHLDVEPVGNSTVEAEAERLRALGAVDVDLGQHDEPATDWIVLADPAGNELCVIPPL